MKDEYYVNRYRIVIKKCCASCMHKHPNSEFMRICDSGEGLVKPSFCCEKWQMHPKLNNAGKGGGKVRKKEFLYFVSDYKHPPTYHKKIWELIEEYEAEFGSRFLTK